MGNVVNVEVNYSDFYTLHNSCVVFFFKEKDWSVVISIGKKSLIIER